MNGYQQTPRFSPRVVLTFVLACAAFGVPFGVFATSALAPTIEATPTPESSVGPTDSAPTGPAPAPEPTEPVPTHPVPTEPAPTDTPPPGAALLQFIVSFRAGSWPEHALAVGAAGGAVVSSIPELRMASVLLHSAADAVALRSDPRVAAVEPDRTRQAEAAPSDALFGEQWALPRIGWDQVYGVASPGADTIVAILDTGVSADHEDLEGRLVGGVSFVDGVAPDSDSNGHGTWMAGIVAGATDNDIGVSGVSWGAVRVMSVTVLDADGRGQDSDVIRGLVHAVESGASVALLAFSSASYSGALQAAIDYAWTHDVLVVAATGNDGSTAPFYPAGDRGVVGVASTDRTDALAPGSNSGPAAFIAAPGVEIFTTDGDGGYREVNGTSAAAAMVAGAAALMRSAEPELANGIIVARLARSAAPLANGDQAGNGRLDLARALADRSMTAIEPQGAAPNGPGGPVLGPYAAAATATWTGGGGDNNWTTAANWGGTAPVAGDDLVFPAGAARLSNTNDFAAGTGFNSITISGSGYALSGNSVALGPGGLTASAVAATNSVAFAMSFAADRTITVSDSGSTLTLGGVASGAGGLIKSGSGVLALSAANTYTGATSVGSGSVDIQANAAFGTTGSGTTVAAGAALTVNGSGLTVAEPLTLNGTGVSGGGALRNLANSNTWSGALTLASASTVDSAAGTLTLSGAVTTAGFVLTIDGAGDTTKSPGVISGTGGVTKEGTGTLTFGVANSYTGATTVNAGTLKISIANGVDNISAVTVMAGATFDLSGFADAVGSIAGAGTVTNSAAGSATLTAGGNNSSTTFSGLLTDGIGPLALTKLGNGTLVLSGVNTYTGVTTIDAGILSIAADSALGTPPGSPTPGLLDFIGATLLATDSFTIDANRGIALTGPGTLSVDPTMTLAYAGEIAGASNLTKTGTGTLVLAGTNTYTGTTTVSGGVLRVQNAAALGATATGTTVTNGEAIEIDGAGLVIAEPITSLNGTGIAATGALRNLANDNEWSGAITLAGATRVNTDGGTFTLSSGINANTRALTVGGAGNWDISAITGTTASLTKDGAGALTLSANSTYTGVTTINAGTLALGVANAVDASSAFAVASGATLDLAGLSHSLGSLAGAGSVMSSVAGAVTVTVGERNTNTTFSGVLSDGLGTVSLTKVGTGTLTLSGANSYSGPTSISAGTISIPTDSGLGTPPGSPTAGHLTFGGGTLLASASFTLDANRGIALTGPGTVSVNSGRTLIYGGVVAGAADLIKVGAGTLVLSGVNTFSGPTTINAGTVSVDTDAGLGTAPGAPAAGHLTFGGGTLRASATFTLDANRGMSLTGAGTIWVDPGVTLAYTGIIDGASDLTKLGTGTLVLSGFNTYTGVTTIDAGTLQIASDSALGTPPGAPTPGLLNFAGATLLATASFTIDPDRGIALTGPGTFSVDPGVTVTYDGVIAGTSTLTKTGTGTLILSGTNTYSGATTISAGVLRIQNADAFGTTAQGTSVTSGATIEIDGAGLVIAEPVSSLAGSGVSTTGAIRNLANDNDWSGAIFLGGGGARVNSDAGTLTLSGGFTGNARPLTVGGAGDTLISGVIATTSGSLTKDDAGTLTLSALNTYTGATIVSVGVVKLETADAVGASSALTVSSGATFDLAGFNDTVGSLAGAGSVTSSGPGSITLTAGGLNTSTTYSGVLSDGLGTVSLTKMGTGTLTLSGANTYGGATTINDGTVSVSADGALGTPPAAPTAGHLTFGGGTLLASASFTLDPNRGIALTGAGTFSINGAVTTSYGGVITGAANLTKVGNGTLVLSGVNTYTGGTNIDVGTLSIAADSALGTPPGAPTAGHITFVGATLLATDSFTLDANRGVALTGAGTMSVDPGVTMAYAGEIAGASNLTKTGTGTLALAGTNTYTGTTTVSGGVLRVQNVAALGATATGTTVTNGEAIEIDGAGLVIAEPITSLNGTGIAATGALRNLANDNEWSGAITLTGNTRFNADGGTFTLTGGVDANTRALTVGGAGNWDISAITGTTATLTKDGAGNLTLYPVNTYEGRTTLNGGVTSITADAALGTPPVAPVGSLLTFGGGTLATSTTMTLDPNRGINIGSGGAGFDVAASTTLTYAGTGTGSSASGVTTKSGGGTLDLSAATFTMGGLTISAGSVVAPVAAMFDINGDMTNDSGPGALVTGTGTVTLSGANGAQLIGGAFPVNFNGLTVDNPVGITIGYDVTVSGTLTFTSGNVTTGAQVLYVPATGSVAQTSGHVVGFLRKHVTTGAPSVTFEVGDGLQYAPVTLAFADVSVAGDLTVSTTSGDHPSLGTSTIDPAASANRYWTVAGPGITFTDYAATVNFGAADIDAGAEPLDFAIARYDAGSWQPIATMNQTPTSAVGTAITAFGEFAVGEVTPGALDHFVVTALPSVAAGSPFDVTVTAVDSVGNRIGSYTGTVTFSSSDAYASFAPSSYAFLLTDQGTRTFAGGATVYAAGTQTVSVADGPATGVSGPIDVVPGAFVKLQILVPGESTDPGSISGKTGTPASQSVNSVVSVTVNAVDAYWNAVPATDTVAITSSDPAAVLPPDAAMVGGTATFGVTFQTGGPTTVTATDVTDGTKTADTSSAIDVTNVAPIANADAYELFADNSLIVAAPGVLTNDTDAESQGLTVGLPRPTSGPTNGTLVLNADGSFMYTPFAGYSGPDAFTYTATDGFTTSNEATVTLTVRDHSLISASGWDTSFSTTRYIGFAFPGYVPTGSVMTEAVFNFSYRSLDAAGTICFYVEVYEGASLLATHGSAGSPVSCNSTGSYVSDAVALPEIDSPAKANALTVRVYMRDSAGARSQINLATLAVDYYLP